MASPERQGTHFDQDGIVPVVYVYEEKVDVSSDHLRAAVERLVVNPGEAEPELSRKSPAPAPAASGVS